MFVNGGAGESAAEGGWMGKVSVCCCCAGVGGGGGGGGGGFSGPDAGAFIAAGWACIFVVSSDIIVNMVHPYTNPSSSRSTVHY